jgi:hypothetical protein
MVAKKTHGMTHSNIYKLWVGMKLRCTSETNRDYPAYGGRGISVCAEWFDFAKFYEDMGPKPTGMSIDRIDNNGPYCKANCRWATLSEQGRNKRNSKNVEFNGVTKPLVQWCEELGLPYRLTFGRIFSGGWSIERAFTTPKLTKWSRHAK